MKTAKTVLSDSNSDKDKLQENEKKKVEKMKAQRQEGFDQENTRREAHDEIDYFGGDYIFSEFTVPSEEKE